MRALPALILALATVTSDAWSQAHRGWTDQKVEITPFAGIQFGGGFSVEGGDVGVKAAPSFGLALDIAVEPQGTLGATYVRQATELSLTLTPDSAVLFPPAGEKLFDVDINYFQVGGSYQFRPDPVRGFVSLTLGATYYDAEPQDVEDEWRFSGILGGGLKVFPLRNLGFRFQGSLLLTFLSGSSSVFCVLPGGCLVTVSGTTSLQGAFSGGLVIAL